MALDTARKSQYGENRRMSIPTTNASINRVKLRYLIYVTRQLIGNGTKQGNLSSYYDLF